ncbi:class I SAM-dependent methyltransferase [Streptomyces noursei]|uniref:class I SAM-dependent methyltransferase n=1 Tax=Streptomyces noursei TaxID=1971 RepID=UPI001678B5F2|nr:methyltransferase domain-containing protein [Streptomyces noursei]MCZ1013471.1 methyltransferase domain-containing protein [Streptomyces noursei]GGX44752.1 methyltransferase type 11 [Streptomyces noursei]
MSTDEQAPEPGAAPRARHEDPYARALAKGRGPLYMRCTDGGILLSEVDRWCAAPDPADLSVLRRCQGAVLDIGCGPGRLVSALRARGHVVLGIDISDAAVARTEHTGGIALCRSVFDRLPGEGLWNTALLMDGNIGIGGDPRALLARIGSLVAPDGTLLVEAARQDVDERLNVRFDDGRGHLGSPFPWARVGLAALRREAAVTGWQTGDHWTLDDRHFLALRHRRGAGSDHGPAPAGS